MSIRRAPRPNSNFYILDKSISEDPRLTWEARGLLVFLLGKPDNWQVSVAHLVKETAGTRKKAGRDAVYAILKELEAAGYLRRVRVRAESGSFGGVDYEVSETRFGWAEDDGDAGQPPRPDQPYADYPETAQPETANPTQTRTDFKEEFKEIASIDENKQTRATLECAVTEVFDHWREKMNHPRAALDPKRKRLIKAALKNYDVKSLKLAIDGCSVTPHNIGMNDRGQRYDGLHIILRDADQIDRFIHNAYNPPKLQGRQARTEAINRQAMEEFLSGEHDPFASGTTTIEGEVIRHA